MYGLKCTIVQNIHRSLCDSYTYLIHCFFQGLNLKSDFLLCQAPRLFPTLQRSQQLLTTIMSNFKKDLPLFFMSSTLPGATILISHWCKART